MSKFLDDVEATLVNPSRRRASNIWRKLLVTHTKEILRPPDFRTGTEHRVGVNYTYRFWLPDGDPAAEKAAILNVREELRRIIYGDALDILFELERALFSGEEDMAYEKLRALRQELAG